MALPVPVSEASRLSETPVAFARVCLCGVETAIAFAGEKWVFLVHFPGAEVMPVSPVSSVPHSGVTVGGRPV